MAGVELPYMRSYIIPDDGMVLIDRDYSQQELRLLAHYTGGSLAEIYAHDVHADMHAHAQTMINQLLRANYERKPIKNTAFGILYGMGLATLAATMGTDRKTAKRLRDAYYEIVPELGKLQYVLRRRAKTGDTYRTWGGRHYHCEPSKLVDGKRWTFEYKMLNYLIQGSASDMTKEALIRMDDICQSDLLLSVHDEILRQCEPGQVEREMFMMADAMSSIECDVEMLSDGELSEISWGDLYDYAA